MSKVLFLVNHDVVIYNFRLELVERLIADGHHVVISSPYGERIDDLKKLGCEYHEIEISRHGMNPVKEIKLVSEYKTLIKKVKPDIVFTYTIKPNIYGGMAAKALKVPYVANITGLGTALETDSVVQKVLVGREIASAPTVLMAAYPVRGLDINSSYTIYNLLNEQKKKGVAVIFVGEDLDVLVELCDRILVLGSGKVTGIVDGRNTTKEEIGILMTKSDYVEDLEQEGDNNEKAE